MYAHKQFTFIGTPTKIKKTKKLFLSVWRLLCAYNIYIYIILHIDIQYV